MSKAIRRVAVALEALVALNAVGGGIYGLSGAPGVPHEWLAGSPFGSYFIPSLFLLLVIGGGMIGAAVLMIRRPPQGAWAAVAGGVLLLLWIAAQVALIGFVSWLQPAVFISGLLLIALGLSLRRALSRALRPPGQDATMTGPRAAVCNDRGGRSR